MKVNAGTLIETIVAATLISLATGLGLSIFLLVSSPASSTQFLLNAQEKSGEILDTLSDYTLKNKKKIYWDESGLNFTGKVIKLADDLYSVEMNVKDRKHRLIYNRKRLFKLYDQD